MKENRAAIIKFMMATLIMAFYMTIIGTAGLLELGKITVERALGRWVFCYMSAQICKAVMYTIKDTTK